MITLKKHFFFLFVSCFIFVFYSKALFANNLLFSMNIFASKNDMNNKESNINNLDLKKNITHYGNQTKKLFIIIC